MGDVTGPISSLPGSVLHELPKDARCDDHPDRPAVVRVQGETDSFGSEMHDLCEDCAKAEREYRRSPEACTGRCDWCKNDATDLRTTRDYEEGLSGPVYEVCGACIKRRDDRLREEDDHYYDDPLDDDIDCR
jgi:hypothetical protein